MHLEKNISCLYNKKGRQILTPVHCNIKADTICMGVNLPKYTHQNINASFRCFCPFKNKVLNLLIQLLKTGAKSKALDFIYFCIVRTQNRRQDFDHISYLVGCLH